jgi:hypothetical protein
MQCALKVYAICIRSGLNPLPLSAGLTSNSSFLFLRSFHPPFAVGFLLLAWHISHDKYEKFHVGSIKKTIFLFSLSLSLSRPGMTCALHKKVAARRLCLLL